MAQHESILGHDVVGDGPSRVIVLNDWLCDVSTWDYARSFIDTTQFTFVFADLRGYGKSLKLSGQYNVSEAAGDVLALANTLGWSQLAVVGHSMSSLVALHLAQTQPKTVDRIVLLCACPPRGFQVDEQALAGIQGLALANDEVRGAQLGARFGDRLAPRWAPYKLRRWRDTANPKAVAAYAAMFARDGLPDPSTRISVPVLAITGEQDDPPLRSAAMRETLGQLCSELTIKPLADSGHYPMQEAPPLTAAWVQQFLMRRPD